MNDARRSGPRDGRGISRPGAPVERTPAPREAVATTPPPAAPMPVDDLSGTAKMYALLAHPQARVRIAPLLVPGGTEADKDDAWERVVANTMRASRNNPDIEKCRGTTILDSVATIVGAWHLEIGENAFLVPFRERDGSYTCTAIMGYTGMAQLMLASGAVRKLNTWCYYENEITTGRFKVRGGTNAGIDHDPMRHAERGALAGAYVVATVRGQVEMWSYMPIEDIEVIRAKSRGWKHLAECPEWYAKKTALRQFAKLIPKSREIMRAFKAIRQDEMAELPLEGVEHVIDPARERPALEAGETFTQPPVVNDFGDVVSREPGDEPEWQDDRDLDDDGVGYGR